jgi:hypothetical protein
MTSLRRRLRELTWLALTAVLSLSLLPTVAHALSDVTARSGAFTEVCTPQGAQWVDVQGKPVDRESPAGGPMSLEHCPCCSSSAIAIGVLPAPAHWQPDATAGDSAPPRSMQAPRTLFAWASAQPRAPPARG